MARLYAQLATLVFAVLGLGGLLLGDAGGTRGGQPAGNLGGVTLQLTWARDAIDIALAIVFGYVGFVAGRRTGRMIVFAAGVFLLILAAIGIKVGASGSGSFHFPTAINVIDLVTGVLAILSALGTIEDAETT